MKSFKIFFPKYTMIFFMVSFLFVNIQNVVSQGAVKEFPYSSDEYLAVLEQHFENTKGKKEKEAKKYFKDLEEKWTLGFFSEEVKERIYETSNLMIKNKMRAIPFFSSYYNTLMVLIEKDVPEQVKFKWMESADFVLKNEKNAKFTEYLANSLALFNDQFIYSNKITQWKANGIWDIQVDSSIRYIFNSTDLVCYTKRDSSNIYETKGVYYPLTRKWIGIGGNINWERAGFDPTEVYANLKNYNIEMKMSKYKADSVEFFNFRYFDIPLQGVLEEQVLAARRGTKALFPAFTSYTKQWKIPEIFEEIDFSGGFKIQGAKLIGIGDIDDPVTLVFKRIGKKFITLKSNSFSIETDRIRSQYASITIHYEQDSIYHSGLRMSYSNANRELSMIRDERGLRADPFFNTYHQLDMFVEAAYWNMNDDVMDFDMIKGMNKRPAFFESNNRYSLYNFDKLQGYDANHPLSMLNKYTRENMTDIIYIVDYARYWRLPYEQIKLQLLGLAHEGFVMYDSENDRVIVKDRTRFYLNARTGKVDYDVILFKSDSTKLTNAELRLDSFDLRINGVQRIILSDSQNLVIEPGNVGVADDDFIVVGKNRNFQFNGKITAGRFSFKAYGCTFDYNSFKLDMPQIDSLWFWVEGDPLPMGGRERKSVQTAIINLAGDILIDHPTNKSGLKPYKEYPVFNSKKDSYAYYDQPFIEKGVYTRDRFYFRISPFVVNSLDNIKTEDIMFDGYLNSGGIFPDIKEPLRVMDDYSLGFEKATPESGLVAYGDKGTFFNSVSLSNQGLRGDGKLDYLKSVTNASDYIFYLDSMNVHSEEFNLMASLGPVEYPKVAGVEVYQHWLPYKDQMEIYSKKNFISMYDEETTMEGRLDLTPAGLSGDGDLHYKVAVMKSNYYDFKNMTYAADTVSFIDDGWQLSNFKAEANYNERKVLFTSNDGTSLVEFPENLYVCYMDEATWHMDRDETTYSKKDATLPEELAGLSKREIVDMVIEGSEFISVHPGQDSLTFKSARANFNSRKKIIKAEGVAVIRVADAAVYPGDGLVTIKKDANMLPLVNSGVLANTTTKYHEIDQAEIKINGKNDYRGKGNYVYLDMHDMKQDIYFDNIRVDTTYQTIASGTVLKESNFTLSPAFAFYGDAHLLASRKTLEFDGGFKIKSGCIPGDHWIAFKSIVEPDEVLLPVPQQPRVPDISNTRKYVGIANSPTKIEVYSLFFQDKTDYFDSVLLTATGFIKFDYRSSEYRISTKEKLLQLSRPDDYISFNANTCKVHAEGDLKFDIRTDDVKIKSYGMVDEKSGEADIRVATAIDFHFSEKALDEILNVFKQNEYSGYDLTTDFYQKVAGGFMGIDEADKYISKILLGQQKRTPLALQHTVFISDMNMKWQAGSRSYISKGDINLGGFLKDRVNGAVEGVVEFKKIRSGDEFSIYFELGGDWFFFNYRLNVMQVISSVGKFNEIIKEDVTGKGKKNKLDEDGVDGKKSTYRYILSTKKKKDDFLTRTKPYI